MIYKIILVLLITEFLYSQNYDIVRYNEYGLPEITGYVSKTQDGYDVFEYNYYNIPQRTAVVKDKYGVLDIYEVNGYGLFEKTSTMKKKKKTAFVNPYGGGYRRITQVHKGKLEKVIEQMEKDYEEQLKAYEEEE